MTCLIKTCTDCSLWQRILPFCSPCDSHSGNCSAKFLYCDTFMTTMHEDSRDRILNSMQCQRWQEPTSETCVDLAKVYMYTFGTSSTFWVSLQWNVLDWCVKFWPKSCQQRLFCWEQQKAFYILFVQKVGPVSKQKPNTVSENEKCVCLCFVFFFFALAHAKCRLTLTKVVISFAFVRRTTDKCVSTLVFSHLNLLFVVPSQAICQCCWFEGTTQLCVSSFFFVSEIENGQVTRTHALQRTEDVPWYMHNRKMKFEIVRTGTFVKKCPLVFVLPNQRSLLSHNHPMQSFPLDSNLFYRWLIQIVQIGPLHVFWYLALWRHKMSGVDFFKLCWVSKNKLVRTKREPLQQCTAILMFLSYLLWLPWRHNGGNWGIDGNGKSMRLWFQDTLLSHHKWSAKGRKFEGDTKWRVTETCPCFHVSLRKREQIVNEQEKDPSFRHQARQVTDQVLTHFFLKL